MRAICPTKAAYKDDPTYQIHGLMYHVGHHASGSHNYPVLFSSLREVPA